MQKFKMKNYFLDNETDTFFYNFKASIKYYLRTFFWRKNKEKIENIISSNEDCVKYFSKYSWRAYTLLSKSYTINKIPVSKGLELFKADLDFVNDLSKKLGVKNFILEKYKILEFEEIEVYFGTSDTMAEEGIYSLQMYYKGEEIYEEKLSFAKKGALRITMLQGKKGINEIQKELTKKLFGLRPHFFILEIAKYFGEALGLSEFYGIKDEFQVSNFKRGKVKKYGVVHIGNYNEIWEQVNNNEILESDDEYFTKLIFYKKPIEDVKSQKRSQYRKRYAMLDNIEEQIKSALKNK